MSSDKPPHNVQHTLFGSGGGGGGGSSEDSRPSGAFRVGSSSAHQYQPHRKRPAASLHDSSDKEDVMRARRSPVSACDGDSFTSQTTDRLATYQISSSPSCLAQFPSVDFEARPGSGSGSSSGHKRKSPHSSSSLDDAKEPFFGTKAGGGTGSSPSGASEKHRLFFSTRRIVRDTVSAALAGLSTPPAARGHHHHHHHHHQGQPSTPQLERITRMYQNQESQWALQKGTHGSADIVKRAATILGFAEALRNGVDWRPEQWQSWPSALTILLQAAWKTVVAKSAPVALPRSVAKAIRSACRADGSLLISPT